MATNEEKKDSIDNIINEIVISMSSYYEKINESTNDSKPISICMDYINNDIITKIQRYIRLLSQKTMKNWNEKNDFEARINTLKLNCENLQAAKKFPQKCKIYETSESKKNEFETELKELESKINGFPKFEENNENQKISDTNNKKEFENHQKIINDSFAKISEKIKEINEIVIRVLNYLKILDLSINRIKKIIQIHLLFALFSESMIKKNAQFKKLNQIMEKFEIEVGVKFAIDCDFEDEPNIDYNITDEDINSILEFTRNRIFKFHKEIKGMLDIPADQENIIDSLINPKTISKKIEHQVNQEQQNQKNQEKQMEKNKYCKYQFLSTDFAFETFRDISSYQIPAEGSSIFKIMKSVFMFYMKWVDGGSFKSALDAICSTFNFYNSFEADFDKFIESKRFYPADEIFQIVINSLFNQELLCDIYFKHNPLDDNIIIGERPKYKYRYHEFSTNDDNNFAETFFSGIPCVDENFNFYLKINYIDGILESRKIREKNIFRRMNLQTETPIFQINNENDDKFIIKLHDEDDRSTVIPYFPLGNLSCTFDNQVENYIQIKLTDVDKIVIILEVARALRVLHQNGMYHGNLWSQSVFLNSKKDAYLGYFCYQRNFEGNDSKSKGPFYYRAPFDKSDNDPEDDLELKKKCDIFSFGTLMHAILTETAPTTRMGNASRDLRISIIQPNDKDGPNNSAYTPLIYCDYLFSGINNECFENGSMNGFKDIIKKCMCPIKDGIIKESYGKIQDVINEIQNLQVYKNNKEEIEYRLRSAINSSDYKCTFADVVKCFYRGQRSSYNIIQRIIYEVSNSEVNTSNRDTIQEVYDAFGIACEDFTLSINDVLDYVIYNNIKSSEIGLLKDNALNNLSRQLISSIYVAPISTLENFLFFSNEDTNTLIIWIYILAKELLLMHSIDIFHGELSLKSIGIYYNSSMKSFVPSIIAFYPFYQKHFTQSNSLKLPSLACLDDEVIGKYIKKDIKSFIKVISNFKVPENLIQEISKFRSVNLIVFYLHNYILKNLTENFDQIIDKYKYSNFQLTFINFMDIYKYFRDKKFKFPNIKLEVPLCIDVDSIFKDINSFLINLISRINLPISESLPEPSRNPNLTLNLNIEQWYDYYQQICSNYGEVITLLNEIEITEIQIDPIFGPVKTQKKVYITTKKRKKRKQERKWFHKTLLRTLEITELTKNSFAFLLERYLLSLNPESKYKITCTIKNRMYSERQDFPIKANDLLDVCKLLKITNVKIENGDVFIYLNCDDRDVTNDKEDKENKDVKNDKEDKDVKNDKNDKGKI